MMDAARTLVLIRHGHSAWNLSNRFTGWTDIPLTDEGWDEARAAGSRLAAEGMVFDEVHASVLYRTHQTADGLLQSAGNFPIPRYTSWRLNERHYGQLQGMSKPEIFARWGEQESHRWWRGYYTPPPPVDMDDPRHPRFDTLYEGVEPSLLPRSESLSDCQRRLLPYWENVLVPRIAQGKRLLVVSHGNTLRSLVMHLEQIDPDAIEKVEIPSGVPLVCRFNSRMELMERIWLE